LARIIWTPEAQRHLTIIFEYVSQITPEGAASLVDGIVDAMAPCERFPASAG
jgi:plasmid stabilization system protein ParE